LGSNFDWKIYVRMMVWEIDVDDGLVVRLDDALSELLLESF
jgi:hypothetical protein